MGIDQLVNAYKGNPQPLQAKVQKAQQGQPPGAIPPDLEEAIALQKITELRNSAQNQQAMQAGGAQPSVVEKLRQMLSAEQRQQAQPPQMPQNPQEQPQGQPQGQPQMAQPPQQPPQGVDALPTNVGQQYAEGGIIGNTRHFEEGGPTSWIERLLYANISPAERERKEALEERAREKRSAPDLSLEGQRRRNMEEVNKQQGSPTDPNFRRARYADDPRLVAPLPQEDVGPPTPSAADLQAAARVNRPAQPRVNVDSAPMPAGLAGLPSVGVGRDYERRMLAENQKFDPEAYKQKYMQEVGAKDLSIYDEMAAELKARKERLKGPEKGFDSLMEYLGQIAQGGGGRSWMEAGAKGAAGVTALQKARQEQQDALVDKILDLGAKKKEAQYGERLGMFNLTKAEKDKINTESAAFAKSLGLSEDKAEELRQQSIEKELDRKNQIRAASIGKSDNLMERAAAIRSENKGMTIEESIRRAALAGGAASVGGTDARRDKAYIDAKNKIDERFQHLISDTPYGKKQKELYDKAISDLNATFGVSGSGINTLPAAAQPIPSGAKPSDLIVGTVYQTARGPAKWNGKAFDPVQ